MTKLCSLLFAFALLTTMAMGQMHSQKNASVWNTPTTESSFNHCLSGNDNMACWINIPGTAMKVFSDNGETFVINSACDVFSYNDLGSASPNTWTYHPEYGCVQAIRLGSDGNVYALTTYVPNSGYALSRWNSSGWTNISCCFEGFALAHGTNVSLMVSHDINNTIWFSTNFGASFVSKPFCYGNSEVAIGYDASGGPNFVIGCTDGKIWKFISGTWTQMPGASTTIAGDGEHLYALNSSVYHWNSSGWDPIVTSTPATSIAAGNGSDVWAIGPTRSDGSNIYRFLETGLMFTHVYTGSVGCANGVPPSLCNTFRHTLTHRISFGANLGRTFSSNWNGNGGWGPNATVFARPQDLFQCLLTGAPTDCTAVENNGNMACSGGGSNNDNAPSNTFTLEPAFSRMVTTNNAPSCNWSLDLDVYLCRYTTVPYCSNTTRPDFNPYITSAYHQNVGWMDVSSTCLLVNGSVVWCLGTSGTIADHEYQIANGDPGTKNCTKNGNQ